jgi:hypothetical protein
LSYSRSKNWLKKNHFEFLSNAINYYHMQNKKEHYRFLKVLFVLILIVGEFSLSAQTVESFSTFHCISLYCKPEDASAENECKVKYRIEGETKWKQGMSLWYDPNHHEGLPERSKEYRGSLVDLVPGTNYEIQLEFEKTGTTNTFFQKTMSETFKIYKTIKLDTGKYSNPLHIMQGGTKSDGYVLYDASKTGHIIDVQKQHNNCVRVDASYVIIRGLTLMGAKNHGIELGNVSNIVIEDCDISGWGSFVKSGKYEGYGIDTQAAISSRQDETSHIIIQRNKLHHPSTGANSWELPVPGTHPQGPQGITLKFALGGNIIRYNEIYSDNDHKFNDGMGSVKNNSFAGFPNRDSDVYCNIVTHCWDDAIEAEGAGMNVRIWGNFVDTTYMAYGLAPQSLGPIYVFRNLSNFTQRAPYPVTKYNRGGSLFKIGAEERNTQYAKGRMVLLNNTSLQPPTPWKTGPSKAGVEQGLLFSSSVKVQDNILSRNNIFHVREFSKPSIRDHRQNPTNSYDYDIYNGTVTAVSGSEENGIFGLPIYDDSNRECEYFLASSSPGCDDGLIIPNFSCSFFGDGPDRGAFEKGLPPIKFGLKANWNEWVEAVNAVSTSLNIVPENLNGEAKDGFFVLFPNPANDYLNIKFQYGIKGIILSVYDAGGIRVYANSSSFYSDGAVTMDVSNFSKGIYIVEAVCNNGIQKSRFVVN